MIRRNHFPRLRALSLVLTVVALMAYAFPSLAFSGGETVYLQFPTIGRAVCVKADGGVKADSYALCQGQTWTLVEDGDGNADTWRLKHSGSLGFLKANADNNSFCLTDAEAEATVFMFASFTYQTVTANRYTLSFSGTDGQTHFLRAEYDTTDLTTYSGTEAQRLPNTMLRVATTLEGPRIPRLCGDADAADDMWLPIHFLYNDRYLKDMGAGSNVQVQDVSQTGLRWKFVRSSTEGYFILKSSAGNYLKKGTEQYYVTTAEASEASLFCLVEDIDNATGLAGNTPVKSLLRLRRKDAANGQALHQPFGGMSNVGDYNAAASGNYFDFGEIYLQFSANGRVLLSAEGNSVVARNVEAEPTGSEKWGIVEQGDDFLLQNANGLYLSPTLTLTAAAADAVKLRLTANNYYNISKSDSTRCRYDLCRADNPALRLALATDGTGSLMWSTVGSSRYSAVRISGKLSGPSLLPQTSTPHNADVHWYSLRFPQLDHYITSTMSATDTAVRNQPRDATHPRELQMWRFEKAYADDGVTDKGEYHLCDIHGNYLGFDNGYCVVSSAERAARFRLLDGADETATSGGKPASTLWRLRRDGATANTVIHPNYGGDTRKLGEYRPDDAKNYMELQEETLIPADLFGEGSIVRTVKFATEGAKALYYDATSGEVRAKIRTADADDFKWTLNGFASDFTLQSQGQYLCWDGTSLKMEADAASAAHFSLAASTYEVYPTQRYDICSQDATKVMQVGADGVVSLVDYVSNRFTTVSLSDVAAPADVSQAERTPLFEEGQYCRIYFEDGERTRLYYDASRTSTIDHQAASRSDRRSNIWKFIVQDAAKGNYVLQNGYGGFLKAGTLTDVKEEADIVRLVEGPDDGYWRLLFPHRGYSLAKQADGAAPAPRRILTEGGMEWGSNVSFSILSESEAEQAMAPEVSDAESGNYWYFVLSGSCALTDKGCSLPAAGATRQENFCQIWKIVAAPVAGKYLLQSNAGNYLRRNAEGSAMPLYTTTHVIDEATPFRFEQPSGNFKAWLLRFDGTEQFLQLNADGSLSEGEAADALRLQFETAEWYIDRTNHTVLHRRNGIYDKQGIAADATDEEGNPLGIDAATGLQSTNEYRVFYYIKKGESFQIESPTRRSADEFKHVTYQRWFDYTTGGCPSNGVLSFNTDWIYKGKKQLMAYGNGWVLGSPVALTNSYVNGIATFTMPANAGETVHEGSEGVTHTIATDYVIAFEMSRYRDFSGFDNPNIDPTEASLQMRAVFEIHEGQQMADTLYNYFRDGKAYKNHAITFPTQIHGSNHTENAYNYEAVPLSMRADSYFCWNESRTDYFAPGLRLELEDPDHLGITLVSETVTGADRLVKFRYPNNGVLHDAHGKQIVINVFTDYTQQCDGSPATKCYVGKFVITFQDGIDPQLYSDVIGNRSVERTPESLYRICGMPAAMLTFDYTPQTAFRHPDSETIVENTYGLPTSWKQASYAYFAVNNPINGSSTNAAWGEYAMVKQWKYGFGTADAAPQFKDITATYSDYYAEKYAEDPEAYAQEYAWFHDGTEGGKNGYLLYIDSSEKPGNIVELPFDGNLCPGSKMYFSAWIASGNEAPKVSSKDIAPASVIFDLVGRMEDGSETLISSYCPGQLAGRYYQSDGTTLAPTNGKGNWQQAFFTFSDHSGQSFDKYLLRLRNNCMSSAGGDILIDDILVFISRPHVEVAQAAPVCGDAVSYIRIESNYETLLSTIGLDNEPAVAEDSETHDVWYCFLDKEIFDSEYNRESNGTMSKEERAFRAALLGDAASMSYGRGAFHRARFQTFFESNPLFSFAEAVQQQEIATYRRTETDGERKMVFIDRVADAKMLPGKSYYLVMMVGTGLSLTDFLRRGYTLLSPEGDCSVQTVFTTKRPYQIKINNDASVDDAEIRLCKGASVTLRAELSGIVDARQAASHGIFHDWWLDYLGGAAFNDVHTTLTDGSTLYLSEALQGFRAYNPTADDLDGAKTGPADAAHPYPCTAEMLQLISRYILPTDDAHPAPLRLCQNTLTFTVPPSDGNVTVIPIVPETEAEGVLYCYEPQQLSIKVGGSAPQAYIGLQGKTYPAAIDYVPIRLGLDDIAAMQTTPLAIPLRSVSFAYATGDAADYLTFTDIPDGQTAGRLRLAGTNDPRFDYSPAHLPASDNLYVVGQVTEFRVARGDGPASHQVKIRLNADFQPREGYSYLLRFQLSESDAAVPEGDVCEGGVVIPLKIVPKYAVWTGDADADWTNDAHWQRADIAQLNPGGEALAADHPLAAYASNAENGRSAGFVPLSFSHVLLPGAVQLQDITTGAGGFIESLGDGATPFIQYDMVKRPEGLGVFTTNCCQDIVVQDGGELVRADRLTYERAWMEYRLPTHRWTTLGTPFQTTFAGDWYVPTLTGRQASPYFSDVIYDEGRNNRYQPAVYQRSWDRAQARLYPLPGDATLSGADDYVNVAVQATWSGVFNDVQQTYGRGGISLKVVPTASAAYDEVLFRIPTEDVSYKYYEAEGGAGSSEQNIARAEASRRFFADGLRGGAVSEETLENHVADNRYFLVSNPFPCGLSLNAFFALNTDFEQKYWVVTADGQQTAIRDEAGWSVVDVATPSADVVLPPGQGFFVKARAAAGAVTLKFAADMMAATQVGAAASRLPQRAATLPPSRLNILASCGELHTTACLEMAATASADFVATEDLECFTDPSLLSLPFVYTLAGRQAASYNRVPQIDRVPLGVQADPDAVVTLRFSGTDTFPLPLYLYDSATEQTVALTDDSSLSLQGSTLQRYYLTTVGEALPTPLPADVKAMVEGHSVRLEGTCALGTIRVYDAGGRLCHRAHTDAASHAFVLDAAGVYVVSIEGAAEENLKVIIAP